MTIRVTTVPESVWDRRAEERRLYVDRACFEARDDYFEVDRDDVERTLFRQPVIFWPTAAEITAGECFVGCDVAKIAGSKMYSLPADPRAATPPCGPTGGGLGAPLSRGHRTSPGRGVLGELELEGLFPRCVLPPRLTRQPHTA